jgi:hypothetical protein
MTNHPQPPNPSRRKLFSWLTDRNAAGEIGAEAGKIVRQAREIAQELSELAHDTVTAVTEPLAMEPDPIPAANADLAAEVERLGEAVAAVQAEVQAGAHADAETQPDATTPDTAVATPDTTAAALLQHQIDLARQLQALQRTLDERLPQAQTEVERSHLAWLRNQTKHLITLFLGATGAALYEALVSDAVYEPLKTWWEQQMAAGSVQAQPASPAPTPEATHDQPSVRTLRTIMQDRHRPAKERLDAGLRLSDLGVLSEGLDDFIAVPGTDFRIGKYPVTNHQFRRFVDAGGYGEKGGWRPPWWSEKGWKVRQQQDWTAPRWWDDAKYNRATQPVVISWYEAEAYCAWLNHAYNPPAGYRAQLPTQEQWMLAARNGRKQAPADEVDYPWGGVFDPALANTKESGLEQTTPVDMYPDGATKAGVYDLAGNVWEWTSELHSKENWGERYWAKGGSRWNEANNARASAALWYGACHWYDRWGCRVVVVPISRS